LLKINSIIFFSKIIFFFALVKDFKRFFNGTARFNANLIICILFYLYFILSLKLSGKWMLRLIHENTSSKSIFYSFRQNVQLTWSDHGKSWKHFRKTFVIFDEVSCHRYNMMWIWLCQHLRSEYQNFKLRTIVIWILIFRNLKT
jgi:hypothetical protein